MTTGETLICCTCKEFKPADAFDVNDARRTGRSARCKECQEKVELERVERNDVARQAETFRQRWQRIVRAFLALREVKELRADQPHTPALARFVQAEDELKRGDLEVEK